MAYNVEQLKQKLAFAEYQALLDTISFCEGANYDDVYNYQMKITDFSQHPNKVFCRGGLCSSAAGAYQFLDTVWKSDIQKNLDLPDFSPLSQDIAALYQILQKKNVDEKLIENPSEENLRTIFLSLSYEWASIPPFRYSNQGNKNFETIYKYYTAALAYRRGQGPKPDKQIRRDGKDIFFDSIGNLFNGFSNLFNECTDVKPLTIEEAKVYRGCKGRINPSTLLTGPLGVGLGAATNGFNLLSSALNLNTPTLGSQIPSFVNLQPGSFIEPMNPNDYTITSNFGPRNGRLHAGIDLSAPVGKDIVASADGTVIYSDYHNGGYGNLIILKHAAGNITFYAHLNKRLVNKNDLVTQGQKIGTCGSTGLSTGPHLHFEISKPLAEPIDLAKMFNSNNKVNPKTLINFTG